MKIVDIRDGFIKIESIDSIPLSSFLQIGDGIKQYIAQVIRSVSSAVTTTLYAKILFINDGVLKNYDGTNPDRNAPIRSCTEEFIAQTLVSEVPICIGDFIENNINIFIDAKHFNKKMLVCFDNKEKLNEFVTNISEQFAKRKKVVIIDMQGTISGEKFVAGQEFKLPLNTDALDFMYNDCLSDATIDSKETVKDMFRELAEYSKTVDFLPFNTLKTIVDDMVDNKHVFKLLVFKNKLQKFAQIGCFAETKNEAESLEHILTQSVATIDLSKLDNIFQNYYLENIYNKLATQGNDIQVFVNASNSISKKNLKNIITNDSISSTFMSDSKFKYLDDIKTFFDNFIIEPSMTINNIFGIYANYLKGMDSTRYLAVGEGTSYIPFVCKVNTEVFEVNEADTNIAQKIDVTEQEITAIQEDIENKRETEESEIPKNSDAEDSVPECSEQTKDEIIENEPENITSDSVQENEISDNESDKTEELDYSDVIDEKTEISEPDSNVLQMTQDDINDIIDSKTEMLANDESISITVGSEKFDMFVDTEQQTNFETDNTISVNYPQEENETEEKLDIDINTDFSQTSVDNDENTNFVTNESDDVSFAEQQEDFDENDEYNKQSDFVNERDLDDIDINEIKLSGLENNSDYYTEVNTKSDEDEILTINSDENIDIDSDILIELDNDIPELDQEALDKEIVDDVDKVFTTIKDDSISIDDLDFIDELNSSNISQNEIPELGEPDAEISTELQEYDGELLVQDDENDLKSDEFVQERLETKKQSTPSVPVYNAEIPQEDSVKSDILEQGDMVCHATYGNGIVEKKCKYGSKDLLLINFDNIGRRALDPTLTELKKI